MKKLIYSVFMLMASTTIIFGQNIVNPLEGIVTFYPIHYTGSAEIFVRSELADDIIIQYREKPNASLKSINLNQFGSFNVAYSKDDVEIYVIFDGKTLNSTPIVVPLNFDNSIEVSGILSQELKKYVSVENQNKPVNVLLAELIERKTIHEKEAISYAQQFFYDAVNKIPRGFNELDYIFNTARNSPKTSNSCWCRFVLGHSKTIRPYNPLFPEPETNIPTYTLTETDDAGGLWDRYAQWTQSSKGPARLTRLTMTGTHESHEYQRSDINQSIFSNGSAHVAQINFHFECLNEYFVPIRCECDKRMFVKYYFAAKHRIVNNRPSWLWSRGQNMGIEDYAIMLGQNGLNAPIQLIEAKRMRSFSANNHNWNPQFFNALTNLTATSILTYLQINSMDSTSNIADILANGSYSQLTNDIIAQINTPIFTSQGSTSQASNHTLNKEEVLLNNTVQIALEPNKPYTVFLSSAQYIGGRGYGKWNITGESATAFSLSAMVHNTANITPEVYFPNGCCSDKVGVFIVGSLADLAWANNNETSMRALASQLFSMFHPWNLPLQGNGLYTLPGQNMAHIIYTPPSSEDCAETIPGLILNDELESWTSKNVELGNIEPLEEIVLTLYPNPMNSSLFIKSSKELEIEILVFDITGKIIPTELNTFDSENNINEIVFRENIASGTYFVKIIHDGNLISTQKILKQ